MKHPHKPYRKLNLYSHYYLLLLLCFTWSVTYAQNNQVLSIESIANGYFDSKGPKFGSWLSEETGYVQLENRAKELVLYDPGTGKQTVLISVRDIIEDHADSKILAYQFSPDESKVIITLSTGEMKEYHILDRTNTSVTKIYIDGYAPDIQSLKLSPDNKKYHSFTGQIFMSIILLIVALLN